MDSKEEESLDDGLMENSSEGLEKRLITAFCCHHLSVVLRLDTIFVCVSVILV